MIRAKTPAGQRPRPRWKTSPPAVIERFLQESGYTLPTGPEDRQKAVMEHYRESERLGKARHRQELEAYRKFKKEKGKVIVDHSGLHVMRPKQYVKK